MRRREIVSSLSVGMAALLFLASPAGAEPSEEGPLPEGAVARLGTGRFRHAGSRACALAFSPDGRIVASGGSDGAVRLWAFPAGKQLHCLEHATKSGKEPKGKGWMPLEIPDEAPVNGLVFSQDGKWIASGGADGAVRLWDPETGRSLRVLTHGENVLAMGENGDFISSLALSPDGKLLASIGSQSLCIWNPEEGRLLSRVQVKAAHGVFCLGGKALVVADGERALSVLEVPSGKRLRKLAVQPEPMVVRALAVSPDGKTVASGHSNESANFLADPAHPNLEDPALRIVRFWDPETGREKGGITLDHFNTKSLVVVKPMFSPDGKLLASADGNGGLRLWDASTGKESVALDGQKGGGEAVAFSPDGKTVAMAGPGNAVCLWDVATGRELSSMGEHAGPVVRVAFSPDGKYLLSQEGSGSGKPSRLWALPFGKCILALEGSQLSFSPDGRSVFGGSAATGGEPVVVETPSKRWEIPSGKAADAASQGFPPAGRCTLSTDGRHALVVFPVGDFRKGFTLAIRIWDLAVGKEISNWSEPGGSGLGLRLDSYALSRGGEILAKASVNPGTGIDAIVTIWDRTGSKLREFRRNIYATSIVFSPDARLLAICGKTFSVVDAVSGKELFKAPEEPASAVFSNGGRYLAVVEEGGRTRLYDVLTWEPIALFDPKTPINAHYGLSYYQLVPHCAAFSPDDKLLAVGMPNGQIYLWDAARAASGRKAAGQEPSQEQLEQWWGGLAESDVSSAYRAASGLVGAGDRAVAFLKTKLAPYRRSEKDEQGLVEKSVKDLDDDRLPVRQKAEEELVRAGIVSTPALRKALGGKLSLEAKTRLDEILGRLESPVPQLPVLMRIDLAMLVLEQVGTPDAVAVLKGLSQEGFRSAAQALERRLAWNEPR